MRDQPHFDVQERPAINGYAFPRERDLCLIHAPLARSTCVLRAAMGTGRAAYVDGATSGAARFTLWLAPSHVAASASCVRRDALSVLSHSVASTESVACGAPAAAGLPDPSAEDVLSQYTAAVLRDVTRCYAMLCDVTRHHPMLRPRPNPESSRSTPTTAGRRFSRFDEISCAIVVVGNDS